MMQAAQPGSRNNSGLSITHCDGSTERSFFVQPQVSSVFVEIADVFGQQLFSAAR